MSLHGEAWRPKKAQRDTATHCDMYTSLLQATLTSEIVISHVLPRADEALSTVCLLSIFPNSESPGTEQNGCWDYAI